MYRNPYGNYRKRSHFHRPIWVRWGWGSGVIKGLQDSEASLTPRSWWAQRNVVALIRAGTFPDQAKASLSAWMFHESSAMFSDPSTYCLLCPSPGHACDAEKESHRALWTGTKLGSPGQRPLLWPPQWSWGPKCHLHTAFSLGLGDLDSPTLPPPNLNAEVHLLT